MTRMKLYLLLPLLAGMMLSAQTQRFTIGATGGMPADTPLGATGSDMPFVLGPTVNVRIFSRLSLETGVLFHRMGQRNATGLFAGNNLLLVLSTERGCAIEIPMLAKYYFVSERRLWRPFVNAGPTVRRTSLHSQNFTSLLSGTPINFTGSPLITTNSVKWKVDPTVGAGVDFKAGRFHLAPEARYSYWGAGKNTLVRKNQVDFLLGFRF
jgi:hypothetical protein